MANTPGMCSSFKKELFLGVHALGPGTGVPAHTAATADTIKAALFIAAASPAISVATTVYSTTGEVTGTGYTPGGVGVTMATAPANDGTTVTTAIFTPSASLVFTTVTLTTAFDTVLLYNSSQGSKAISVHTFGAQTITAGTLTLTMPVNAAGTALLQIS
jgi:hypothetical protein